MKKVLELRGIEPRAFHMQSERSTTELQPLDKCPTIYLAIVGPGSREPVIGTDNQTLKNTLNTGRDCPGQIRSSQVPNHELVGHGNHVAGVRGQAEAEYGELVTLQRILQNT